MAVTLSILLLIAAVISSVVLMTYALRLPAAEELETRLDRSRSLPARRRPGAVKVRTTIMSEGSSVHLELAGAAGLGSNLPS